MEEITKFIGRAAALIAFCGAITLATVELSILQNLQYLEPAGHVFKTIIRI